MVQVTRPDGFPPRPVLGAKIEATREMIRETDRGVRKWTPASWDEPKRGVYVGYRYKHNGVLDSNDELGEYGTVLARGENFLVVRELVEVWLMVYRPDRNPVSVDPLSVTVLEGEHDH